MTTDLQSRVAETRATLDDVEDAFLDGATVLGDLRDALDRVENDADPVGSDGSVADLVGRARETFGDLQRDLFGWHLELLRAGFETYDPAGFDAVLADLRRPFADLDAATVQKHLDELTDFYWKIPDFDPPDDLEAVRTAFESRDRQAYEDALDALGAEYDHGYPETIRLFTSSFSRLFGSTYERAAKSHVEALVQAFLADDESAFETQVASLETAFENEHATVMDDRANALEAGLNHGDASKARDQIDVFDADVREARNLENDVTHRLNVLLEELVERYPDHTATELSTLSDPLQPVLMLPVNLETRFSPVDAHGDCRLKIRVYPDDAHVDTHERGLTPAERHEGRRFWKRVWWAAHDVPTDQLRAALAARDEGDLLEGVDLRTLPDGAADRHDAVTERAWAALAERFDDRRAAWVKRATAPEQGDDLLAGPVAPAEIDAVDFSSLGEDVPTLPAAWTRPPRARLLPDRWVAIVDLGHEVRTVEGGPIREPLAVGPRPDPTARGDSSDESGAPAWTTDFEAAKRAGMGLETELDATEARDGVESIVVVGVKSSMTADESARALRDLLDAHHFTDGLSFLEQGTPTNNVAGASAGGNTADPAAVELGPSLARPGTDGAKAARLLGLDPEQLGQAATGRGAAGPADDHVFGHVPGADGREQRDARHFNTALWSATWGYYVPHMLAPAAAAGSPGNLDYETLMTWLGSYRDHFVEYVRARGPTPTLRVGDQPYGLLPATTLAPDHWERLSLSGTDDGADGGGLGGADDSFSPERYPGTDVLGDLVTAVRALRSVWDDSTDDVTVLDDVGAGYDAVETLLDLLSLDATSVGYRARDQFGEEVLLDAADTSQLASAIESEVQDVQRSDGMAHLSTAFGGTDPRVPRVAETLFWDDETDPVEPLVGDGLSAFLDTLLGSPFGALSASQPGSELVESDAAGILDDAREEYDLLDREPSSLLQALLYYATLQEYGTARARLGDLYDDGTVDLDHLLSGDVWHLVPEPETYDYGEDGIVERMHDLVLPDLADHPSVSPEDTYADALDRVHAPDADRDDAGNPPAVSPRLRSHAESLSYLADRDLDEETAERLLTETLDLASHRLDAWATSIATRRLDDVRTHQAATGDPGVYVGGWGYVTDVQKTEDPDSDGYLHAPSLEHATTGAVLRNGSLAFEGDRADLLDLDLSPDRVRRAMDVIETVREGQDLGTLLGYRFERRLRECSDPPDLDRHVPAFRRLAPPVAGKQNDESGGTPSEAGTRDVVDGLALYRKWQDDDDLFDGFVTDTSARDAIDAIFEEFDDTLDAVTDLLTAESVHQLLQGRSMRTGASLDALARGEAPPEIDVVETPRTGTGVTHRIAVLFGDANPDAPAAWPSTDRQVRADAEPNLDAWVADLLPDPSTVACTCTYRLEKTGENPQFESGEYGVTLADLGLSPLDLLSVAEGGTDAQRSELEQRVLYHVDREYGVPEDATVELTFGPVSEWDLDPAKLGLPAAEDLVSFGEALAAVEPLSDLVSTGRPADARDLRRPAAAGDPNRDAGALRSRANFAVNALDGVDEDLTTLLGALEDDESGRDDLSGFETAADAVAALPPSNVSLTTLAADLDGIDASALRADVEKLHATLEAGVVSLATVDGVVEVAAESGQTVEGVVAADPGTELSVTLQSTGAFLRREAVTVEQGGRFAVTVDASEFPAGREFTVEVAGPAETLTTVDGVVVETVEGTPTANPDVGPVSVPALESFADALERLESVGDAAGPLRDALGRTDLGSVRAVASLVDWQAVRQAPDWDSGWPSDVDATVDGLLSMGEMALPGFDHQDLGAGAWQALAAVVSELDAGTELLAYPAGDRAELRAALDAVAGRDDATVESAAETAATSAAATLRTLADLKADAAVAADAFRVATLEAVRDALMRASHFGVGSAVPQAATGTDDDAVEQLTRQAAAVADETGTRLGDAPPASDPDDPDAETELDRIEAVFEESFTVLAPFSPTNATELGSALTVSASETLQNDRPMQVETWFRRTGRVRDAPETLGRALTSAETIGSKESVFDATQTGPRFRVGQLPYETEDHEYDWVGLPDAWDDDRRAGRVSLVTHAATPHGGAPKAGLLVDEWVETVPDDEETTGVAFQHDRPTNQPPQSMLLAAPPNRNGWSLDALADVVEETMALARARTVDPSTLEDLGHFLPALSYARRVGDDAGDPATFTVDFDDLIENGGN